MAKHGFTLYSTAQISREEYTGWLHQLNAVMIPEKGGIYDARLSKDVHHVWISLLEENCFDMTSPEFEDSPEVFANICQLLGGVPRSAIVLTANDAEGSQILAVQFAALCTEHYPCAVLQSAGQAIFSAQTLLKFRDAGMGFDGSTWETAHSRSPVWTTRIIAEVNKQEEAKKRTRQYEEVYDYRVKTSAGFDTGEQVEADGHEK